MSGPRDDWKAANPTIEHFAYALQFTVPIPGQKGSHDNPASGYYADMERWYGSHKQYDFENAFLHRGGHDAAHRVQVKIWDSMRYGVNPGDAGQRAYQIDRLSRVAQGEAGVFLDEFGGPMSGVPKDNDEFPSFVDGLLGLKLRDANVEFVHLDGHARSRASADLYLTLLYSLTGDVAHLYDVSFDWRRYRRVAGAGDGLTSVARAHLLTGLGQRAHRIRHTARKVVGLPDQEFEKMLRRAVELWGEYLAPGDRRFSLEPERQRGKAVRQAAARRKAVMRIFGGTHCQPA
jgi:hypothetical protein